MPTTIELPQVGESVTEGVIGKWLKQPGDHVEKYDALVEVMTDKVTMEVPSPFTGTLSKVLVAEGDTVQMGAAIGEMDVDGDALLAPEASQQHSNFEFVESVRSVGPTGSGEGGEGRPDADVGTPPAEKQAPSVAPTSSAPIKRTALDRQRLSPLVRRLAQEHGVDVSHLSGSGLGGRITKEDVLKFVAVGGTASPPQSTAVASPNADEIGEPLTPLRKLIADNMIRSASEIPSAWSMVEVDVSGLVACRDAHKNAFQQINGATLTYLSFVVKAVTEALRGFPRLNSRWGGDRIFLKQRVNIGVAVATGNGLVVPVVHDADGLTVAELASSVHDLADRARHGALKLEDVQDGTFTVNNTGALGSVASYPIINYPQAAILTTEAIVKRPVVTKGDAIAVRSVMNMALAFDRRICDGAEAGGFLASVKSRIESIAADTAID